MKIKNIKLGCDEVLLHASSISLAIFGFYSLIFVANLLKITFYLGYKKYIINITVLSVKVDKIIWAASITLFSAITVLRRLKNDFTGFTAILNREMLALSLFYGILILLAIEVASLARWIYNLFHPSFPFSCESWHLAFTETQLTNIFYPALPVLLMFFAYSWVGEFTFKGLLTRGEETEKENVKNNDSIPYFKSSKISIIIIVSSFVLALFIGYYNYAIAGVNNPGFPGVDVPHYTKWLNEMLNKNPAEALVYASENNRFLYLILQYICFSVSGSSVEGFVAYSMPVILTFLLMLSTFFFVRADGSLLHASIAMLVTVFSFHVTVGLFAGFYANWFALTFVYIFYGLLIRTLKMKHRNALLLVFAGLSSLAVLFTHPWTWILLVMIILVAYIVTTLLLVLIRKADIQSYIWELKFLLLLLAVNILMFYVKGLLGVGSGAALVDGYVDTQRLELSPLSAFRLKYLLDRTFNLWVGGFYAFAPIIILAIFGVLSILDYENNYNRVLLNWVLIASAMVLVDFPWQARFLYLTPFNIYVAQGILYGAEELYKFSESRRSRRLKHLTPLIFWVFYALSILLLLNYAVRCIVIKQYGPSGLTLLSE